MRRERVRALLYQRIDDPTVLPRLLEEVPAEVWLDLQAEALTRALTRALQAPHWRARVDLTPARIAADPFAAALAFPPLRKTDYWDHAAALRLGDVAVAHRFYTSGTESGVATEQPWDAWTFDKSFGEASALALAAVGARPGDRVLSGTSGYGALGRAYAHACRLLGLHLRHDPGAFADPAAFAWAEPWLRQGVDIVIGAPGAIASLIRRLEVAGIDPRSLGVRAVLSGVGASLSERHVERFAAAFDPEFIHEQGGKNEILHAPGGRRYARDKAAPLDPPGHLRVLPWAAHVVAVDRADLEAGRRTPLGHQRPGVLLMTRLSAGRSGCAAFVNDAGDVGETAAGGGPGSSAMPSFRFLGRTSQAITNKLGDTIFSEEFLRALTLATRDVGLAPALAAELRIQALLVRDADPRGADSLFWILGAPADALTRDADALVACARRMTPRWPRSAIYEGPLAAAMRLGGFALIDAAGLPHGGRDKARYPLALERDAAPGETHAAVLHAHVEGTLGVPLLRAELTRAPATP